MSTHGQHAAPRFRRFRVWPRPAAEVTETAAEVSAQDTPPAPEASDDTMVWRIPSPDGGPSLVIPPGAPWVQDAEDREPQDAEPLPQRTPGAAIPPALVPALRTEPSDPDLLREVIDKLKALPAGPAPARPVAWLRVHERDGGEAVEALSAAPEFAGTDTLPDGTVIAGAFLGIHGKATWIVDAVDPAWCDDAITALTAMRDALVAAQGDEAEGEAAA